MSPPLFAVVMDVVSSHATSGLPSKLPYADDLVLMESTIEQSGRRVAEWRASLLDKGLKARKLKIMIDNSGGKMIVNYGKAVHANSVICTVCKKWCRGVRGNLSLVVDGFRCKRCDCTIQEVDVAEDLVVVGETY